MKLILGLDNIRSTHNVGAIARTAYGFGISEIVTIGITPHMRQEQDDRLPHVIQRAEKQISKTALGGEAILGRHFQTHEAFIEAWATTHSIISIEKTADATPLNSFVATSDTMMLLGNEVDGVSPALLQASEHVLRIPIAPVKESYNVSASAAIALYELHTQFATLES